MGATPFEAILSGLALGGVLAITAAWSRSARTGPIPHLGVGATAGLGIVLANRLEGMPAAGTALVVLAAGVLAGLLTERLDRRVSAAEHPPERRVAPPLLADVAVLGALLAATAALRPPLAIPLPFGPLGGRPGPGAALAAVAIAGVAVWVVASRPRRQPTAWWVAGGATAVAAALAAGSLWPAATALIPLPTVVDGAGLAFRAVAAALVGRGSPWQAAVAGLGLGLAEGLLWLVSPTGLLGAAPALVAAGVGLWLARVPRARLEVLGP